MIVYSYSLFIRNKYKQIVTNMKIWYYSIIYSECMYSYVDSRFKVFVDTSKEKNFGTVDVTARAAIFFCLIVCFMSNHHMLQSI